MVMSGRSVNLITLFLGRLMPLKRLTSTSCTHFRQKLTTALLESTKGETKVCGWTGFQTQDIRLGYSSFSVYVFFHLQPNGEAQEIMSVRQGPVRLFRVLPSPDTGILI